MNINHRCKWMIQSNRDISTYTKDKCYRVCYKRCKWDRKIVNWNEYNIVTFAGSQFLGGKLFSESQWHMHLAITAYSEIESWGINATVYKNISQAI